MTMKLRWDVFCRTRSRFRSSAVAILASDGVVHSMLKRPDYGPLLASGAA